jgi:hypothetical protein
VKRQDARRANQRNEFCSRLHPPARDIEPVAEATRKAQSTDRLSDNAKNTIHAFETSQTRRLPGGSPTMPDTRIRPLVARQPTLPAWFDLPSSSSPAAR